MKPITEQDNEKRMHHWLNEARKAAQKGDPDRTRQFLGIAAKFGYVSSAEYSLLVDKAKRNGGSE